MLRYSSHAVNLRYAVHLKGLDARIVLNVPHLNDTLSVRSNKLSERRQTVNTNERVFMLVQLDDVVFKIRVPNVDCKVKAHTYDNFVDFAIS